MSGLRCVVNERRADLGVEVAQPGLGEEALEVDAAVDEELDEVGLVLDERGEERVVQHLTVLAPLPLQPVLHRQDLAPRHVTPIPRQRQVQLRRYVGFARCSNTECLSKELQRSHTTAYCHVQTVQLWRSHTFQQCVENCLVDLIRLFIIVHCEDRDLYQNTRLFLKTVLDIRTL